MPAGTTGRAYIVIPPIRRTGILRPEKADFKGRQVQRPDLALIASPSS
jgi:hypothetical protein